MYEDCLVELKRGSTAGTYVYRVVNVNGESVYPRTECSEKYAMALPLVYNGAHFNFKVIAGGIVLDESIDDLGTTDTDLDYDENAERVTVWNKLEAGKAGRDLNITKLEEGRGDETNERIVERKLTYEQQLAIRKAQLDELNAKVEREIAEEYGYGGNPEIDRQIEEEGYYFDPNIGSKCLVAGHGEQLDYYGLHSLVSIPIPTEKQIQRYEKAKEAGVPEDRLPMSPDEIRSLAVRAIPTPGCKITSKLNCGEYGDIPVYSGDTSKLKVSSKNLTPNLNMLIKWTMVVEMVDMLDVMAASMIETDSLNIIFTERPNTTMGVTADSILVGIDYLATHSIQEIAFVLIHESRHLLNEHPSRRGVREPEMWNLAADLIVNKELVDSFGIDVYDKSGGRLCIHHKDKNTKVERDFIVSDGRPRPKFPQDGSYIYSDRIDLTQDTVEKVYLCLEMGVDSYDAAKALRNQQRSQGGAGAPPAAIFQNDVSLSDVIGKKLDQPDEPKDDGSSKPSKKKKEDADTSNAGQGSANPPIIPTSFEPDMSLGGKGTSGGGSEDEPSVGLVENWSSAAYLYKVVLAYAGMLKSGMNTKGEKISPKDAETVRKILAPYMAVFNLRF